MQDNQVKQDNQVEILERPRIASAIGLKKEKNTKYILSFGAGVNSTAMLIFLIENKFPLDYVVFADTGDEMPETYAYIKKIRKYLK